MAAHLAQEVTPMPSIHGFSPSWLAHHKRLATALYKDVRPKLDLSKTVIVPREIVAKVDRHGWARVAVHV